MRATYMRHEPLSPIYTPTILAFPAKPYDFCAAWHRFATISAPSSRLPAGSVVCERKIKDRRRWADSTATPFSRNRPVAASAFLGGSQT